MKSQNIKTQKKEEAIKNGQEKQWRELNIKEVLNAIELTSGFQKFPHEVETQGQMKCDESWHN